ncbi:Hypothetical protein, putative [Bodo saltans]|uniref:Uncharacterized protein n=1 Tax=Bodo saltans TaxID=75058 RepID=A0A0S4IVR2_BODSA|nr:Hypothetical protein, putative [Bodo saltans]|eukprot:CUG01801.1 Hypothetical protein, putative [Bodo saltans]
MLRCSRKALASSPGIGIAPETTPVKYTPSMLKLSHSKWYDGKSIPYRATFREKSWLDVSRRGAFNKGHRVLLTNTYSPAALQEATKMIPSGFEVRDVPRPPQRIRAQSEGIVGRWFTNYWTLHSIKYQCQLARVPWEFGERQKPTTNYDEPFVYTDYEESKALRDFRSRWINVNRSLVGMSKRMKESEEEARFSKYRRVQETFWSNRKVLINRVKSMHNQGTLDTARDLPIKTFNIKAFLAE